MRCVLRACCCWFEKFAVTYRRWSLFIFANKHYPFCLSSDWYNVIRKARRRRKEKQSRRKPAEMAAQGYQPVDNGSSSIGDECANYPVGMMNEPTRERVSYRPNDVCQVNNAEDGQSVKVKRANGILQAERRERLMPSVINLESCCSSFHLVTAIFMKPWRRKAGSFSWQKIESMTCIYMAVKDQGAVSDETHENAQSSEPSAKNPNKLEWSL
ncbi:hypothetical protein T06_15309 [Trichinella sp. T6]|nr:hypothetical protein T06_15309 [Trichinella sp. T6]